MNSLEDSRKRKKELDLQLKKYYDLLTKNNTEMCTKPSLIGGGNIVMTNDVYIHTPKAATIKNKLFYDNLASKLSMDPEDFVKEFKIRYIG